MPAKSSRRIVIDGVFFQYYSTGIARVWRSILSEWRGSEIGGRIVLIDRDGTLPETPGFDRLAAPRHDYGSLEEDRRYLQKICAAEGAELFMSTYYSTPLATPSLLMVYDMIPERLGHDANLPAWREKRQAIAYASAFACISKNTARDLSALYPKSESHEIRVIPPGVAPHFRPADAAEIAAFRGSTIFGDREYFLFVGSLEGSKNGGRVIAALARLPDRDNLGFLVTGGHRTDQEWLTSLGGMQAASVRLNDEGLRLAYAGAIALVFPSLYEGFGMPVIEAMACGCPVITSNTSSLPEVAGNAALQVAPTDTDAIFAAMKQVRKASTRAKLVRRGLKQAENFSWRHTAGALADYIAEMDLTGNR